jgi:hypothetical protein
LPPHLQDREILMAVLSTAMVAPMDGLGHLNATRVMAACRADGYILKPDAPATPVDACFGRSAPELCHIYTTRSTVLGFGRVTYVFMDTPEPLTPALLGMHFMDITDAETSALGQPSLGNARRSVPAGHVVYNWYTQALSLLKPAESQPLGAGYEGHAYALVSPLVNGWAFLGQLDKYAPASRLRFPRVSVGGGKLSAGVVGIEGETVRVCAAYADPAPTALALSVTEWAMLKAAAAERQGQPNDGMMPAEISRGVSTAVDGPLSLVCDDVKFKETGTLELILEAPQFVPAAGAETKTVAYWW